MRTSMHPARQSAVCVRCCSVAVALPARPMKASIRKALAKSTPAQFSSFHGAKMFLPQLFVCRSKLAGAGKQPAQMSFLGVGAPEALLVGVVALVVFGPKGLAEAAKGVGKTLRAFQPTIREVVEASQDIRGTLEQELGLNELRDATRPPPPKRTPTVDEDEDIEAKRKASAAAAWNMNAQQQQQQGQSPQPSQQPEASPAAAAAAASTAAPSSSESSSANSLSNLSASMAQQGSSRDASSGSAGNASSSSSRPPLMQPSPTPPASAAGQVTQTNNGSGGGLNSMSIEELEAELARRRQSST